MAIVVKWKADGQYFKRVNAVGECEWTDSREDAKRFGCQCEFSRFHREKFGYGWSAAWGASISFIRLVPRKRHASPKP